MLGGWSLDGFDMRMAVAAYTPNGGLDQRFGGDGTVLTPLADQNLWLGSRGGVAVGPGRQLVVAAAEGAVARYHEFAPAVEIASLDSVAHEEGQNSANFLVIRDDPAPTPLRIFLDVGGTASPPGTIPRFFIDYDGFTPRNILGEGGYVDIPAGETFAFVTITPADDTWVETDETAVFTIRPGDAYDVGDRPSASLTIRDNEPPAVVSARFDDDSSPHRLHVTFSQFVKDSLSAIDVSVLRLGVVPMSVSAPTYDVATNTATFSFGGTLLNSSYTATIRAAGVTNMAGTSMSADHVMSFRVLAGDADRNARIDADDYFRIDSSFLAQPPAPTYVQGDFNYDGRIDADDYFIIDSAFLNQGAPAAVAITTEPQQKVRKRAVRPLFSDEPVAAARPARRAAAVARRR
jgi:hypothetical protein